jgi:hypothetical protein
MLLQSLSIDLRTDIVTITHSGLYKYVKFFKNKTQDFTNAVVHELMPLNIGTNELIFSNGEETD